MAEPKVLDRVAIEREAVRRRGFRVSYPEPPWRSREGRRPTDGEIAAARVIVLQRINEKLATMKRAPRWTKPAV